MKKIVELTERQLRWFGASSHNRLLALKDAEAASQVQKLICTQVILIDLCILCLTLYVCSKLL